MKIFLSAIISLLFWLSLTSSVSLSEDKNLMNKYNNDIDYYGQYVLDIYTKCNLKEKLEYSVFSQAMIGYHSFSLTNKTILTIIDFSKPSTQKRFFIIDIENQKLLLQTFVAHGKNSGINKPTRFSNMIGSNQSSLGFYKTAETYFGKHGYSLILDGLEKGINDNARRRAIVIHGAEYVSKSFIERYNRLGRSWGCPAVSEELSKKIIDIIKSGTCLFIYSDSKDYLEKSITPNPNIEPDVKEN